jgi:hypothetical protein
MEDIGQSRVMSLQSLPPLKVHISRRMLIAQPTFGASSFMDATDPVRAGLRTSTLCLGADAAPLPTGNGRGNSPRPGPKGPTG